MMDKEEKFGHMDKIPVAFDFSEDQSPIWSYIHIPLDYTAAHSNTWA